MTVELAYDIARCFSKKCPRNDTCARYTSAWHPDRQVVADFYKSDEHCQNFINNEDEKE